MDLIDVLLQSHATLRRSLEAATGLLGPAAGAGWDDRRRLDKTEFSRRRGELLDALEAHESFEDDFLARIVSQVEDDPESALIKEGRGSIRDIARLYGTVAGLCDGEHVYRLRTVLHRLTEELEAHLEFEERRLFPWLRARIPEPLLRELGHRAMARRRSGFLKTVACE